jgi:bifunctional oligoribonuclease and PAP phosphatase NrnA
MNNTFKEIASVLNASRTILLYPHVSADGDALGSCTALCKALRMKGKECYILVEEELPLNLKFLDKGYCTDDQNIIEDVDVSFCVDCGDETRFPNRTEKFAQGKVSICLDHHRTTKDFCDYNYVVPEASATGELVFDLLQEMGTPADVEIGEALFAAITTDTGNFQYSNTTRKAFEIMTELLDWGVDTNKVSVQLYENIRLERKIIESMAFSTMNILADGKAAIAYVTQEMIEKSGALSEETENVIQQLRSIAGVEYAAFLKEKGENLVRLSLRAKTEGDVAVIAEKFGGGGHIKASGATLEMPIEEAVAAVTAELEAACKELK